MKSLKPSLVIGLGRTGQWVTTYLKAKLLREGDGEMPPCVRLAVLDSARRTTVRLEGAGSVCSTPFGSHVELEEPSEYVYIGEAISDYVRETQEGLHPHVTNWFQAETHARKVLARSDFRWGQSAASFRQLGRLSLFQDLQTPVYSRAYNLLNEAIGCIRDAVGAESLNIFLVGSLVGTTGSGMFIDVAYLARQLASDYRSTTLWGYFLLAEAFRNQADDHAMLGMRCRAYAALRELHRLCRVSDVGHPFHYQRKGQDPIWRGELRTRLFDHVYLLDGRRSELPLCNVPLERGLAPSLADAIRTSIDPHSDQIGQHRANVSAILEDRKRLGQLSPETYVVGSLGVYTIILPVQQLTSTWMCRLGLEVLDILLKPLYYDQTGLPIQVSPDANREAPRGRGCEEVEAFLKSRRVSNPRASGQAVELTQLPSVIARLTVPHTSDGEETAAVFSRWTLSNWCRAFEPPGEDDRSTELRRQMEREFRSRLLDPSSGILTRSVPVRETPAERAARVSQQVKSFKDRSLGVEDPETGQRAGGHCQEILRCCSELHLQRFKEALRLQVLAWLEGQSESDPRLAKEGKLGYVHDFLQALTSALDQAQRTLAAVQSGRSVDPDQRLDALIVIRHRRKEMERQAMSATGIFACLRPRSTAEQRYLEAEQDLIDMVRFEIMDQAVKQTLSQMISCVHHLKTQIEQWMRTLALGQESVYAELLRRRQRIADHLTKLEQIESRWTIRDGNYEEERYQVYVCGSDRDWVAELLTDLTWTIKDEKEGLEVNLSWCSSTGGEHRPRFRPVPDPSNAEALLRRCRPAFSKVRSDESIVNYLMHIYPDPVDLADMVHRQSSVLLAHEADDPLQANYLRVATAKTVTERAYVDAWMQRLAQLSAQSAGATGTPQRFAYLVQTSECSSCSLLTTEELLPLRKTRAADRETRKAYWLYRRELLVNGLDRRSLHVLPAEVNAVYFEDRLDILGELCQLQDNEVQLLDDEVVTQLERPERLRLFLLGYVFGLIGKEVRDKGGQPHTVWALTLPATEAALAVDWGSDELERWQLTQAGHRGGILEAVTTFSFRGQDQERPDIYHHPIPYQRVTQMVKRLQEQDAKRRVKEGTAGQRMVHTNRRNLIPALRGEPREVALRAAARIDRLSEAEDRLRLELAQLCRSARDREVRLAIDLYSVFVLMLQQEKADLEKIIKDQIIIVTGVSRARP